ncbi:MraY family glycosyltransferase [uncultured Nitrosomonas sp.]|uniref:MraY family glycosyltransferase n=1 Tax=uncultured Nitrosomonas sp. TaxID=156424 RepID=UPI0025E682CF|nr:MraY family glycosyltransferase [uncultured Nitrosomonas sp.]
MSAIAIRAAAYLVQSLSMVDRPDGGHKLHDSNTPFVGGVGLLTVVCLAFALLSFVHFEMPKNWLILGLCSAIIFITGFVDDIISLSYKLRIMIQAIVALVIVLSGDMMLNELGGLLWGQSLQLSGWFAIAFTVIAIIGGINAINMIDGIDGLSGSISLVSLFLIGIVAFMDGDQHNLILITALAGGMVGFLYYNLRYASKRYARVFLGDNGSMLIGFILGWLLIDLSQGLNPAMTPITAVWLFSMPLLDSIGVMLRRVCLGKSPFMPDHLHLHHLFLKAGFFVSEITFLIVSFHILFGIIGLMGLYLGVPEFVMLFGFLLIFLGYFLLTLRPWRFISMLRHLRILFGTRLGFAPAASCKIFSGNFTAKETENIAKTINEELGPDVNFSIRIFEQISARHNSEKHYAITFNVWLAKEACLSEKILKQQIALLQQRLKERRSIRLRVLSARDKDFDLKACSTGSAFGESLIVGRRSLGPQALTFEVMG